MEDAVKPTTCLSISFQGDFTDILRESAKYFESHLDHSPNFVAVNFESTEDGGFIADFYWSGGYAQN